MSNLMARYLLVESLDQIKLSSEVVQTPELYYL